MPLVKATLTAGIKSLLTELSQQTDNQVDAIDKFADRLAGLVDAYVKSATVTVTVTTAGTAAAQTGTGTGNLS